MAGQGGASLFGLSLVSVGAVLIYAGVNDAEGGPIGVVTALLRGQTPTPGARTITGSITGGEIAKELKKIGPSSGVGVADVFPAVGLVGAAIGAKVVAVAQTYMGVPYALGGASRRSIDCSGLVMVSYREAAGIDLPHKATAQAARGRRIPRDQARPGDLVAWGVPGNYPHIAIVVDGTRCIGAWTWGDVVRYGKIDHKAVPGFGLPDIIRIVG